MHKRRRKKGMSIKALAKLFKLVIFCVSVLFLCDVIKDEDSCYCSSRGGCLPGCCASNYGIPAIDCHFGSTWRNGFDYFDHLQYRPGICPELLETTTGKVITSTGRSRCVDLRSDQQRETSRQHWEVFFFSSSGTFYRKLFRHACSSPLTLFSGSFLL